jgi:hypothetical protein
MNCSDRAGSNSSVRNVRNSQTRRLCATCPRMESLPADRMEKRLSARGPGADGAIIAPVMIQPQRKSVFTRRRIGLLAGTLPSPDKPDQTGGTVSAEAHLKCRLSPP